MFDSNADELKLAVAADPRLAGVVGIEWYPEVDSTNDIALARAEKGAPAFTVIMAGQQHAGRGRRGRSWFSPPGAGLYLSIVLRPTDIALPLITLGAGVAVARAATGTTG